MRRKIEVSYLSFGLICFSSQSDVRRPVTESHLWFDMGGWMVSAGGGGFNISGLHRGLAIFSRGGGHVLLSPQGAHVHHGMCETVLNWAGVGCQLSCECLHEN